MAAHRFWGISCTEGGGGGAFAFAKILLLDGSGANVATDPAKAAATDTINGNYPASRAIVGQDGFWASFTGPNKVWWYDCGAALQIAGAMLTARAGGDSGQAPTAFDIVSSDDAATFTAEQSYTTPPWASSETKPFSIAGLPPPPPSPIRVSTIAAETWAGTAQPAMRVSALAAETWARLGQPRMLVSTVTAETWARLGQPRMLVSTITAETWTIVGGAPPPPPPPPVGAASAYGFIMG